MMIMSPDAMKWATEFCEECPELPLPGSIAIVAELLDSFARARAEATPPVASDLRDLMLPLAEQARETVVTWWATKTQGARLDSDLLAVIEQATFSALQRYHKAEERERCAQIAAARAEGESAAEQAHRDRLAKSISMAFDDGKDAGRAEGESAATERCAQIAEAYPGHPRELTQWEEPIVRNIAGAIRAAKPTRKVER